MNRTGAVKLNCMQGLAMYSNEHQQNNPQDSLWWRSTKHNAPTIISPSRRLYYWSIQYLSIGQYWHEQNSVERYLGDVYALLISKLKYLIEIDIRPRVFILLTISNFEFIFHLVIKAQTIVAILSTGSGWVFLYFGVHKFRCSS